MKKTLFAILALGSLAMADTASYDIQSTLPTGAITLGANGELTLENWALSRDIKTTTSQWASNDLMADYAFDDTTSTTDLTFTITNTSSNIVILESFTFDVFAAAGGGTAQGSNRSGKYTLTVGSAPSSVINDLTLTAGNLNNAAAFDIEDLELGVGESANVTLSMQKSWGSRYFAGVSNMDMSYTVVPEPTTATLSLLALAGLVARRRRK